jgi:internalin A
LAGLANLLRLVLFDNSITDLGPLGGLTRVFLLDLGRNSVPDLTPLSALADLTVLGLERTAISDLGPLTELTFLSTVVLDDNNDLVDIQPLIDNTGLGIGDTVHLVGTHVSCADMAALEANGVMVLSECP